MNRKQKLTRLLRAPRLTTGRIVAAMSIAVIADGLQLLLGPLGWGPFDEIIDVIAMALIWWAVGYHVLLLPTFIVELFPLVDMLPTWTACVAAVIALKKRAEHASRSTGQPFIETTLLPREDKKPDGSHHPRE